MDRDAEEEEAGDTADNTWDRDTEEGNEVSPGDGLQDLQYFPNFYRLLRSLDSGKTSGTEREGESQSAFTFGFPLCPFSEY